MHADIVSGGIIVCFRSWGLDEACVSCGSVLTSEGMSVISASLTERLLRVPAQKLDSTSLQAGTVAPPNLAHLV